MAQHTRQPPLTSEAHCDLVRSSFGLVLLYGSCVQRPTSLVALLTQSWLFVAAVRGTLQLEHPSDPA
jgi:hypothetical protein